MGKGAVLVYKVFAYSLLMLLGIVFSQIFDLSHVSPALKFMTIVVLGYIMIEVGLEFTIEKNKLKSYGKDFLIASTAAAFPWILCSLYFWTYFDVNLSQAAIIGRFAAPTSAGVLFTMLAAAGLATTWVYKKARILAILDDLDTILLIVPLQMAHVGFNVHAIFLLVIIVGLLIAGYRFMHQFKLPITRPWLLTYAFVLAATTAIFEQLTYINIEILLPAFILGCTLYNPHPVEKSLLQRIGSFFKEGENLFEKRFDDCLKYGYMLLVGCTLPKISLGATSLAFLAFHALVLTFLSNLGKLYPMLCYKKEASFRERVALSVAMWPRGEVGAGILVISTNYAITPIVLQLAQLSLALNLALTGVFIYLVIWILRVRK